MAIDWDKTTSDERRCLLKPVSTLKKRLGQDWAGVFRDAFGPRDNVGDRYEDNLRKGLVSPTKAYKLFSWISKNDPALADTVESEIFALRAKPQTGIAVTWEILLATGIFDRVRAIKAANGLEVVHFSRRDPVDPADLKLLDEFYFEIDAPVSGQLLVFQGYLGNWYVIPLTDQSLAMNVRLGLSFAPLDPNGRPDPLREETTPGRYAFLFVIVDGIDDIAERVSAPSDQPLPMQVRDDIAKAVLSVPEENRAILRTTLLFKRA